MDSLCFCTEIWQTDLPAQSKVLPSMSSQNLTALGSTGRAPPIFEHIWHIVQSYKTIDSPVHVPGALFTLFMVLRLPDDSTCWCVF